MLNKPKYMTPSTNLHECVIDINADIVPFSCTVDGNDAIWAWQIQIYTLIDNAIILDTGKQILDTPFFPIDSKNRNVVFNKDIKKYMPDDTEIIYYPATSTYDKNKTYYKRSGTNNNYTYTAYSYSSSTWDSSYSSLFYRAEFKNSASPYYWTISFWSATDKDSDAPTVLSCEEIFYANSTPEIRLSYKPSNETEYVEFPTDGHNIPTFSMNEYSFKAKYLQGEGVPLKRYGWRIMDTDNGQLLTDTITSNNIYGTSENIVCSYDGFLNNITYSVEVYIETQNNMIIYSSPMRFLVSYQTTFLSNDFVTEFLIDEAAVRNSWSNAKAIEGRKSFDNNSYIENYPIVGGGTTTIEIPQGEYVIYDYGTTSNLDITENSYIVLSMQLLKDSNTELFFAEGTDSNGNSIVRKLSFEYGQFKYVISDSNGGYITEYHTPADGYKPNKYVWYVILMAPYSSIDKKLTVIESRVINGLYPDSTLYPSSSIYPDLGEWETKLHKEVETE